MIKKYGGYVITVLLSLTVGVVGTAVILPKYIKAEQVTKTVSEVQISESDTISPSIQKIYKAVVKKNILPEFKIMIYQMIKK